MGRQMKCDNTTEIKSSSKEFQQNGDKCGITGEFQREKSQEWQE